MKVHRSVKLRSDGVEEHTWHFDRASVTSFGDKCRMYLGAIFATHLLCYGLFFIGIPLFMLWFVFGVPMRVILLIVIVYFSTYVVYKPQLTGERTHWNWFKRNPVWKWGKFHFDAVIIRLGSTDALSNRQYIFGIQPHAIMAFNRGTMMGDTFFDEVYPGHWGRYAAATPQFYTPGVREACIWAAAEDASRSVCEKVLSMGDSLYIWVGGTRELFSTDPNSTDSQMVISDRKGFIKLAIRNGIDIIPVMQFGEKFCYHRYVFSKRIKDFLYQFKIPAILFWGQYFTFYPYSTRPHPTDASQTVPVRLGMVFGQPIAVKQQNDVDPQYLDEIHCQYKTAMRHLFDTYKSRCFYEPQQTLTMV